MYFVYRSHYEGPLSRRVRELSDRTVLAWFQRSWACEDPEAWLTAELGGDVYGLSSIFKAARQKHLPRPQTTDELRALLHEHLYVEGDEDYIRLDEHSLRVRTDDDEVELAYFFLDDEVVAAAPGRLAYLLHESWPLPDQVSQPSPFTPDVPVTVATLGAAGEATTYAIFLTFYDSESMAHSQPLAIPGVDLPALASHLRTADMALGDDWPPELLVLRALIAPGEDAIGPALDRCNRWPGFNLNGNAWPPVLPAEHDAVHREAMALAATGEYVAGRRPDASLLRVGEHLAQLAMHCGESFGYQQWYLFDTVWAATHPTMAQSLLRYANHWDPLDESDVATSG